MHYFFLHALQHSRSLLVLLPLRQPWHIILSSPTRVIAWISIFAREFWLGPDQSGGWIVLCLGKISSWLEPCVRISPYKTSLCSTVLEIGHKICHLEEPVPGRILRLWWSWVGEHKGTGLRQCKVLVLGLAASVWTVGQWGLELVQF